MCLSEREREKSRQRESIVCQAKRAISDRSRQRESIVCEWVCVCRRERESEVMIKRERVYGHDQEVFQNTLTLRGFLEYGHDQEVFQNTSDTRNTRNAHEMGDETREMGDEKRRERVVDCGWSLLNGHRSNSRRWRRRSESKNWKCESVAPRERR